jgi:ABC-2 type transport system permease protein
MNLKRVRLLIWKEFVQLRRDPLLLRLLFIMPILQLVMFGYVIGADVKNLSTAVVDLDRSATSRKLVSSFEGSGYFRVVAHPSAESQIRDLLDHGTASVALVIPEGTELRVQRGESTPIGIVVDGADSRIASTASGYSAQIIAEFNQRRIKEQGIELAAPGIDARVRVLYNPSLRQVNAMLPSLIAFVLLISTMSIMSQAVVRERERGTLEQMFVTPISRADYLVGKVTPYMITSIIQMSTVAFVGRYWFKVPFNGQIWVLLFGLLLFMMTAVGLGLLVSLLSRTRTQAQQTVMFIMIPSMVLSGFIFPIDSMPPAIVPLTYVIPLRYAVVVMRSTFIKGSGFGDMFWPLMAMVAFSAVIFGLAVANFSKRLSD